MNIEETANIDWNEIIKKEARGIDDADFGKVQSVESEYVSTQKGIFDKEYFSFPKNLVQNYDGYKVLFKVTEEEARTSYMQKSETERLEQGGNNDYSQSNINANDKDGTETTTNIDDDDDDNDNDNDNDMSNKTRDEMIIPLMSENLEVNKTELIDDAIITKEPVRETKTIEVPVMREELILERRPVSRDPENEKEIPKPVENNTQIKIPLRREEVEVTKTPYVIEELVVRKKSVTKMQTLTEEIITEKVVEPQG
ncbi:MAG TPA: YsnF/AvaK domain-containing protein [Nitrososphaeraceae archaeon]